MASQSFLVLLALTVFNLPQMTRNVEDSFTSLFTIHNVKQTGSRNSRWETVLHVVIPEASTRDCDENGPTGRFSVKQLP